MKFEAGQRVILTDNNFYPTQHCPVWGSPLASVGLVLGVDTKTAGIQWGNGAVSYHYFSSLSLYNPKEKINPNQAFLLKKQQDRQG